MSLVVVYSSYVLQVYTIVIKLPGDSDQDAPTVKQYHGCYEESRRGQGPMSRRPSSQDMRLPLNAAKIMQPKQLTRAQGAAFQAKEKKKKKFQEKKSERKAAKTLSAILLTFIITWTPYNILVLLKPFTATAPDGGGEQNGNKEWVTQGVWDFFYYLCYINSTINPVCYALCNATFRMTYVRILKCKWNTRRQPPPHFRAWTPAAMCRRAGSTRRLMISLRETAHVYRSFMYWTGMR